MSYTTKEQYDYAVHIDLADWLLRHHPSQVKLKYGSVKAHGCCILSDQMHYDLSFIMTVGATDTVQPLI